MSKFHEYNNIIILINVVKILITSDGFLYQ